MPGLDLVWIMRSQKSRCGFHSVQSIRQPTLLQCAAPAQIVLAGEDSRAAPESDHLVGIYYFAGWWQKSPKP